MATVVKQRKGLHSGVGGQFPLHWAFSISHKNVTGRDKGGENKTKDIGSAFAVYISSTFTFLHGTHSDFDLQGLRKMKHEAFYLF